MTQDTMQDKFFQDSIRHSKEHPEDYMTPEERENLIRVVGPEYEESDIPAYVRQRGLRKVEKDTKKLN